MLSPVLTIRVRRTLDTNLLSVVENPDSALLPFQTTVERVPPFQMSA
jgi:hypothetical protein